MKLEPLLDLLHSATNPNAQVGPAFDDDDLRDAARAARATGDPLTTTSDIARQIEIDTQPARDRVAEYFNLSEEEKDRLQRAFKYP